MDLAGCVTSIRPFFDICLFFSRSVSLLFSPLSSFLSPHYYCQISLIMKYRYCMTAKMGRRGEGQGEQGSETANHNRKKKKRTGDLGFSIKGSFYHHHHGCYHHHYRCCVCAVCLCLCVGCRSVFFFKCVGGVISLPYIAPLTSLFKG